MANFGLDADTNFNWLGLSSSKRLSILCTNYKRFTNYIVYNKVKLLFTEGCVER